jgi:peptidoglycan/LPS O-acetylase OafA/YrhL
MAGLGRVSYAFYLWHGPILAAADAFKLYGQRHGVPLSMPVMFVLSFAVSLLAAVATTKLIEIPVLRARDRWMPEQRATANRLPMVADLVPSTTGTS